MTNFVNKGNQGFTLLEILVSILIGTIFVTASLQLIIFSAVFRVKAQESSEAKNLIAQDIENIRNAASSDNGTEGCNATSESDGFAHALLESDQVKEGVGDTVNFSEYNNDELDNKGAQSGKEYSIERTQSVLNREPYDVVKPEYNDSYDGESVASVYTEVIVDETFNCPPQ